MCLYVYYINMICILCMYMYIIHSYDNHPQYDICCIYILYILYSNQKLIYIIVIHNMIYIYIYIL